MKNMNANKVNTNKANVKVTKGMTNGANALQLNQEETTNEILTRTVLNNAYSICGKKIASVPVSLLCVDKEYQRETNSSTIHALIREWDMQKCNFLRISYRDGKFYIIDGQHRTEAAKYLEVKELPCIILTGLSQADEALIFSRQNRNVKVLNVYNTFDANLCCGDMSIPEVAIDMKIKKVCDKYNVKVGKVHRWNNTEKYLRSLSRARWIVAQVGEECFEWIIRLIDNTNWSTCSLAYTKEMITMLRTFYTENEGNLSEMEQYAVAVLNKYTPMQIDGKADKEHSEYGTSTRLNICFRELIDAEIHNA